MAPPITSVGFLLIPGFALMSYACVVEPLRAANQIAGSPLYRWWNATPDNCPAISSNGAAIVPDFQFGSDLDSPDMLLVCAGGNPAMFDDQATYSWLRRLARHGVIIGGISGGPVIIAKAGLLDGRRCTLHWEHLPAFHETFPEIELTRSLFELDGDRVTCSGGIAGLDMMVALVARDHGPEFAAAVSDWLLHTQVRAGVELQRMDLRFRLGTSNEKLLLVLKAMEANLETPLTREELGGIAGLSPRHLERVFARHLKHGVHRHYLALRLGRARQMLRETSLPVLDIALATGFGSSSHFARAFRRAFGYRPGESRGSF